jgi:UDP-N-acetylglucosamine 2-epimerase (non-hydrolysing)
MKMAPILRAFDEHVPVIPWVLVHTGQHYDHAMNERLFSGLRLPTPHHNLEVGSGTHAVQTAEIMKRFEPLVDNIRPSCVLVVGDVNSTWPARWWRSRSMCPLCTSRPACAAVIARCRKRSTAS